MSSSHYNNQLSSLCFLRPTTQNKRIFKVKKTIFFLKADRSLTMWPRSDIGNDQRQHNTCIDMHYMNNIYDNINSDQDILTHTYKQWTRFGRIVTILYLCTLNSKFQKFFDFFTSMGNILVYSFICSWSYNSKNCEIFTFNALIY